MQFWLTVEFLSYNEMMTLGGQRRLLAFLWLLTSFLYVHSDQSKFQDLLDIASTSKKIHIIADLTRNGHRLQIEELLDLDSWTQFIQFTWHERVDENKGSNSSALVSKKVNFLVRNDAIGRTLTRYEPYICNTVFVPIWSLNEEEKLDWLRELPVPEAGSINTALKMAESLVSLAPNSPYAVQITSDVSDSTLVLGISALWIRAQLQEPTSRPTREPDSVPDAPFSMQLLDSQITVKYFFEPTINNPDDSSSIYSIELKSRDESLHDLIQIVDISLDISLKAIRSLFLRPVGYNCRGHTTIAPSAFRDFDLNLQNSHKVELEFVATKYYHDEEHSKVGFKVAVKSISYARSRHPMNGDVPITMFQIHDERTKIIRDFKNKLSYSIQHTMDEAICRITSEQEKSLTLKEQKIVLNFYNGLIVNLNEDMIDDLLWPPLNILSMDLLDTVLVSDNNLEYIFESELPKELVNSNLIEVVGLKESSISIVRVYTSEVALKGLLKPATEKGFLTLDHIKLLIFNADRSEKLAEIRVNKIDIMRSISLTRRAKLFNISPCFNIPQESMDLVAVYPVEPEVADLAKQRAHEFIENFYDVNSMDGLFSEISSHQGRLEGLALEERKLHRCLNFFRVPKVDIEMNDNDRMEIHFRILEKVSPLLTYTNLENASFVTDTLINKMTTSDVGECAKLCSLYSCNTFSFVVASGECKISPHHSDFGLIYTEDDQSSKFKIILEEGSVVYLNPNPKQNDEVTLAEFYSYFVQSTDESSVNEDSSIAEFKSSSDRPLLSLELMIMPPSEYPVLPKKVSLAPTEVRVSRMPHSLNTNEGARMLTLNRAFKVTAQHARYCLSLNDKSIWSDATMEKTFHVEWEKAFYTLRHIPQVDWTTCAQLCYDINDFNDGHEGGRICFEMSHCGLHGDCELLIKSDSTFLDDAPNEIETIKNLSDIDKFLQEDLNCKISTRNFLASYEGPINLPLNYDANKDEKLDKTESPHKWYRALTDKLNDEDEDVGVEQCALSCSTYNKGYERCLAFDYCRKTELSEGDYGVTTEQICNLLLVVDMRRSTAKTTSDLRNKLMQPDLPGPVDNGTSNKRCSRFLISHSQEYSRLHMKFVSKSLYAKLEKSSSSIGVTSLDECATECSIRNPDCKVFKFCTSLDRSSQELSQSCTLLHTEVEVDLIGDLANRGPKKQLQDGCHFYMHQQLRRQPGPRVNKTQSFRATAVEFIVILTLIMVCISLVIGITIVLRNHFSLYSDHSFEMSRLI